MDNETKDLAPKPQYERPEVIDYGTLTELTLSGGLPNADVPHGVNGTANPPS
ncbi:MAG: lasso RiPP family leader peptide-containing protein [Solirubrobacteraceae bacterium]|jgi:hypothetical protein